MTVFVCAVCGEVVDELRALVASAEWAAVNARDEFCCPWCGATEGGRIHSIDCRAAMVMGWSRRGAP